MQFKDEPPCRTRYWGLPTHLNDEAETNGVDEAFLANQGVFVMAGLRPKQSLPNNITTRPQAKVVQLQPLLSSPAELFTRLPT